MREIFGLGHGSIGIAEMSQGQGSLHAEHGAICPAAQCEDLVPILQGIGVASESHQRFGAPPVGRAEVPLGGGDMRDLDAHGFEADGFEQPLEKLNEGGPQFCGC